MATSFFRPLIVPCLLYIDDRHNGQLQISLDKGIYGNIQTLDERRFSAAKSALFLVDYFLIQLGYFLELAKSVLSPRMVVPYLGFLSDSARQVFHLIPEKKNKFLKLIREVLDTKTVTIKTLPRLVGKCVSFSLVVPGARLFTKKNECGYFEGPSFFQASMGVWGL